jgi:hypothetical protein
MKVLVNGPSTARGPNSWPYFLQQKLNFDLINLSQAGAGNNYICDATIEEFAQRPYDLAIIMWADLRRFDIKVKDIDYFADTIYTSRHQKSMNDWPEKQIYPVNDQDYVGDNWVFGCGYINDPSKSLVELFENYYKHTDIEDQYYSGFMKIIALQSFFKSRNQPYVFCGVRKLVKLDRFGFLYDLLDFDHIINDLTPHDLAKRLNDWDSDGFHPGPMAQRLFADRVEKFLNKND